MLIIAKNWRNPKAQQWGLVEQRMGPQYTGREVETWLWDGRAPWGGAANPEPQFGAGSTSQQGFCGRDDMQEGPSKGRPQPTVWDICTWTGKGRLRALEGLVWGAAPGPQNVRDAVFPLLPAWCPLSRGVRRMLTWPSS